MTRRVPTTVLLVLAIVAGACSGPPEPLEVGLREVASDITIGAGGEDGDRVGPAPVPPTAVVVDIAVPTQVPAPERFAPTPAPTTSPSPDPEPADPCPRADPLSSPAVPAPHDHAIAPREATYPYRNDGSFAVSGANSNEGRFTQETTRTVRDVSGDPEVRFTYDVAAELGGTLTTTTYEVRNTATVADPLGAGSQTGADDDRGLYLAAVRSEGPDGSVSTFAPAQPLLLLPFPAFAEAEWDAAGTDPASGITMSFHGRIAGRVDVDACGAFVDAFRVELTQGRIVGPLTNVEFAAVYDLATQYGGLSVHDVVQLAGTEGLNTVERRNEATISRVPAGPPS